MMLYFISYDRLDCEIMEYLAEVNNFPLDFVQSLTPLELVQLMTDEEFKRFATDSMTLDHFVEGYNFAKSPSQYTNYMRIID